MNKLEEIVDQNGEKETFTYDSQGRMASHIDRNHVKTIYGYNMDDQLRFKRAEMLEDTSVQAGRNKKPVANRRTSISITAWGNLLKPVEVEWYTTTPIHQTAMSWTSW